MLSKMRLEPILSALLSRGGEYGELFYEEANSLSIQREDGKIERVLSGTRITSYNVCYTKLLRRLGSPVAGAAAAGGGAQ